MRLKNSAITLAVLFLWISQGTTSAQQHKPATDKAGLKQLQAAVEKMPDSLSVHEAYIKAMDLDNPVLARQYGIWMKRFPKSAMVPFALGHAYTEKERPAAKPYLLKAVAIQPRLAQAWEDLWIDAERWGDFKQGEIYLRNATESDPSNADFAFYYAYALSKKDTAQFRAASLDVVRRFPDTETAPRTLFWLAYYSADTTYKIKIFEQIKNNYSSDSSNIAYYAMSQYYSLLLATDPRKAAMLAQELKQRSTNSDYQEGYQYWIDSAEKIVQSIDLVNQRRYAEAETTLANVYGDIDTQDDIELYKARTIEDPTRAYDSLMRPVLRRGSARLRKAMIAYGSQTGKSAEAVDADIYQHLSAKMVQATDFSLQRYLTPGSASLADFKGKVVLLTYWFPGCGPCRGEFPHFENVIRKFKDQPVSYVGINIVPVQNAYVVPFMKQSGYSFTPLQDVKGRQKGNMDNHEGAPVNFLLDQQGRIVFKNFRIDKDNENDLDMMIRLLLEHPAS